jgi:hypothetical protein
MFRLPGGNVLMTLPIMPISGSIRRRIDRRALSDLLPGFGTHILSIGTGSIYGSKETHRSRRSDPQSFRGSTPAYALTY